MQESTTVGLDLATNVFHLAGQDRTTFCVGIVLSQELAERGASAPDQIHLCTDQLS